MGDDAALFSVSSQVSVPWPGRYKVETLGPEQRNCRTERWDSPDQKVETLGPEGRTASSATQSFAYKSTLWDRVALRIIPDWARLSRLKSGSFQTKADANQTEMSKACKTPAFDISSVGKERCQCCLPLVDGERRGKACKMPTFAIRL